MPEQGLVTLASKCSAADTLSRLRAAITDRKLVVFAEFDHSANAVSAGLKLRPTVVVVFGNPSAGTPIMQDRQTAGLDLPLKILVWEDEHGVAQLTWNDPLWIGARHQVGSAQHGTLAAMGRLVTSLAREAAGIEGDT